jgi:N-acetylglucosaminyldiphosphoundecaprenol N-acetyl-beta-D-mannosaminyltransferase
MFRHADLLVPDGIGIVLAARILHKADLERVPGCELMQNICALSAEKGYKLFIYGGKEGVNKKAVEILRLRHPSISIVGRSHGYVPQEEMGGLIDKINASGAQILFVALGSPAQEKWISTHKDELHYIRVCQGIGGTLDVIAGNVKRAPEIYCRLGLEWLYRLMDDPKRAGRQKVLPLFAWRVFRERFFHSCQ